MFLDLNIEKKQSDICCQLIHPKKNRENLPSKISFFFFHGPVERSQKNYFWIKVIYWTNFVQPPQNTYMYICTRWIVFSQSPKLPPLLAHSRNNTVISMLSRDWQNGGNQEQMAHNALVLFLVAQGYISDKCTYDHHYSGVLKTDFETLNNASPYKG